MAFKIVDRFQISDRGTAVVIDAVTDLPVGTALIARVIRPDGTELSATTYKEWLLRRDPTPLESEAFLLLGVDKAEIPEGSLVELSA